MFMMRFDMRAPGKDASERAARYRAAIDMAAWAETNGCVTVAVSEHHVSDDGYLPSPFTLAAAIAAVTSQTPIVVAAALLPLYDPVRLAEELVVLDHISAGRVMVVLGIGYRPVEYELHGVDYSQRGRIADRKLEALLDALRDAADAHPPETPRVTPAPFSPGGPMLAWGGRSIAAARRAGRFGLGFFAQTNVDGLEAAYVEAAHAHGHEPGMCILPSPDSPTIVFVSDDLDAAWRDVGPSMLADATSYAQWNEAAGSADVSASISRSRTIEEMRRENRAYRVVTSDEAKALVPVHGPLALHPLCGGLDPDVAWSYLRRAADAVRDAGAA